MEASFKLGRAILNNIYITANPCGDLVVPCMGGVKLSIGAPLRMSAMASKWRIESGKTGHLRAMLGDPAFEYIVQKNEKLDSRTSCEKDIKDPIQNYISINFSFPLQGGGCRVATGGVILC